MLPSHGRIRGYHLQIERDPFSRSVMPSLFSPLDVRPLGLDPVTMGVAELITPQVLPEALYASDRAMLPP